MQKRILIVFALAAIALAAIMLLTSCSQSLDNVEVPVAVDNIDIEENDLYDKGPVKGGIVKLFSTTPDTLNPVLTQNIHVQDFLSLVFEGLVKLDKTQKPIPMLSDRWSVSTDGLIWTFHIRQGVFWHNKMPFTAEDVKFTFDIIQQADQNNVYKKKMANVAFFAALDKNNFRIHLKKPSSFTPETMTIPIIQKSYFGNEDIFKKKMKKNMEPSGTGPFKYHKGKEKGVIHLVPNAKWWNAGNGENDPGVPYVNGIDIMVYNKSVDSISAFHSGKIDVTSIQSDDFNKYIGRPDVVIRKYPGKNYEFLAFNLSRPVLKDKAVRTAIAYALDKVSLINSVAPGQAIATDIPIIPSTWLYDTGMLNYKPDKYKAREILKNAGWREKNGVFYKRLNWYKQPLKLELLVNENNETRCRAAEEISRQLKEVGIGVTVTKISWEDEWKKIKSRRFDMVVSGCKISSIPDISFAYSSYNIGAGYNIAGYKNTVVDQYLGQLSKEHNTARKKVLFTKMREIINNDLPYIGLYFNYNAILYNKRLRGDFDPSAWSRYNDITRWYIPDK